MNTNITCITCPRDMCKFNNDGTCSKTSIVLKNYILDDDLEAMTCESFKEKE